MSLSLQAKLLRVIQEREVRRVGSNKPVHIDARIIAATNQPLEQKVKQGLFREDLLYRLKVVPIMLPPLRERPEDIPLLSDYFLKGYCTEMTKTVFSFSPQAMDLLCRYSWPGILLCHGASKGESTAADSQAEGSKTVKPKSIRHVY